LELRGKDKVGGEREGEGLSVEERIRLEWGGKDYTGGRNE
jgi:hypothetical protein